MRFPHFFIDRPIFATVLSIVIILIGGISYYQLPVSQYPEVALPTVVVSGQYPGATAETVAKTVATPLEQEINGVEGMLYMESQCTGDGRITLTITFGLAPTSTKPRCWCKTAFRSPSRGCPGGPANWADDAKAVAQFVDGCPPDQPR